MKRLLSILIAAVMLLSAAPAFAFDVRSPRTTLLDLTGQTTQISNSSEGWSFVPAGSSGEAVLTLTNYGSYSAHSAPVSVPRNTRIVVNGNCYLDNVYMNEPYSVIKAPADGYLKIEGTGTLNLYAEQYRGRCIEVTGAGGDTDVHERLYIIDLTVNCYSIEPGQHTAFSNEPCIFANSGMYIDNATVNTRFGKCGLWAYGYTPIGGVTEDTAEEIVINNSTVNILNTSTEGTWQYANGIHTTFGKIRVSGSSSVNITAGSQSIYCYLSFTVDGGTVNVNSTPVSTADSAALVYVGSLHLKNSMSSIYFKTTRYPNTKVLFCRNEYESTCQSGVNLEIGSFSNGNFTTGQDSSNNGLPALKASGQGTPSFIPGDANANGAVEVNDALITLRFAMGLIGTIPSFQAADVDGDGTLTVNDALKILRAAMSLITL